MGWDDHLVPDEERRTPAGNEREGDRNLDAVKARMAGIVRHAFGEVPDPPIESELARISGMLVAGIAGSLADFTATSEDLDPVESRALVADAVEALVLATARAAAARRRAYRGDLPWTFDRMVRLRLGRVTMTELARELALDRSGSGDLARAAVCLYQRFHRFKSEVLGQVFAMDESRATIAARRLIEALAPRPRNPDPGRGWRRPDARASR